ncbi:MAG TPA: serine hydrolase domain-containing protein [Gammaproteobacteria bacterium]|jgi:CubicO group peptidase (beta-lactamase class C family)
MNVSRSLFMTSVVLALPIATVSAGSMPRATPEDVGLSSARLERIGEAMDRHIEAGDVAGVVTLVARHGRIAHLEAHGFMNIETHEPMRTDAIFGLASMSKPVTAVAIMLLVEEGKIRLSDPVSRFIPEFANLNKVAVPRAGAAESSTPAADAYDLVPATREITIRDLLTHGSGLMSGGLGARIGAELGTRGPNDTLATYIPKLAGVPLDFQPGTLWRYSGLAGFDVLSRVVEVVSGQPFDEFLAERLFEPLDMPDTGFYFSGARARRLATNHARTPQGLAPAPRPLDAIYFSGAGGLASTAEDYLQFAQMLLNGGELDGERILGPRTVALMTANHTGDMVNGQFGRPARGMGFGLGMEVVLDPVAAGLSVSTGAFSWQGGTGVGFWAEPEEDLVSVFMVQGGAAGTVRRSFENAVRQAIID